MLPPHSDQPSYEYRLQREPVGVVILDPGERAIWANRLAAGMFAHHGKDWQGAHILDLHPQEARDKVRLLLDTARNRPELPAGMVLTLPSGTLVSKVTALDGPAGQGFCMLFHMVDRPPAPPPAAENQNGRLLKLPLSSAKGLALMDVSDVVCLKAEGHYSRAYGISTQALCSLPLAELERRLDPARFLRVHRGYLVNLDHALGAERRDGQWVLLMNSGTAGIVPVSRAHIDDLRRHLAI
ncbi:MAG TPA: LytTR family transcriptional regulator DNA-binding domain-containing protein [Candidatus Sulfotelmatobacter sp.]|jgi:hypothetical protein|nr:LytTR family transcriptional regulator DNA-binding domain-containing protein [Candidatus Sulfotelmatobacter sp.]